MPMLSPLRAKVPALKGLKRVRRGKVRDTYQLPSGLLLIVATDGISIFDFVLNALIPEKGKVLTAMSHYWLTLLEDHGIRTHFVAAGADIDGHLPEELRGDPELQSRAMVVRKLEMHPYEFIGRFCLTGSVLKEYTAKGTVYGAPLPKGFQDGDLLPYLLDTPTDKAEEGHDMPVDRLEIRKDYGTETLLLLDVMQIIGSAARERGIMFADTKVEMGLDVAGKLTLGDEIGTPDSSRFWDFAEWQKSRGADQRRAPPPFDKQRVRAWGIEQGLHGLSFDPLKPADVRKVHELVVPETLIRATTQTYRYIFWRLTGLTVEEYFHQNLGMTLERPPKKLAVLFGSESDIPLVKESLGHVVPYTDAKNITVNVISCHRNPDTLQQFVDAGCDGADVVVAAGGMAFALPGVLDALIHKSGRQIPVVGVALGAPGSVELQAAQVSISQLPGQPVVMDEVGTGVYTGKAGFIAACRRALYGELPPPKARAPKPPKLNLSPDAFFAGGD